MNKLVVIFPGIGYHCDKPLLYYGRDIAHECGYTECIKVSYTYDGKNIRGNEEKMKEAFECLYAQAEDALSDVKWDEYEEILFISKSIGTIIASAYAKTKELDVKHVLYTPLTYTFDYAPKNSIAFIGTDDPWSDVGKVIEKAHENDTYIYIYGGCNHSLECEDTRKNLENISDVISKTYDFLKGVKPLED